MTERTSADKEHSYVCGRCGLEQYAQVGKSLPVPCIDCGYIHKDRKDSDVPSEIKYDIS